MKDFFKNVGATILGILLFNIIVGVLFMMSIMGMIASGESEKEVKDNSVLTIRLAGTVTEQKQDDLFSRFYGSNMESMGVNQLLSAINKAKNNKKIKGIYLEAGMFSAGYGTLQEIRNALRDFKKSGKWIVSYGDNYTQGAYYLASVGDKVFINPQGILDWHGIGSQSVYLKDFANKLGIKFQVLKVGNYKSATEIFTGDKMSDYNRQQIQAYIGGMWRNVCSSVAESRKISTQALNAYADNLIGYGETKQLLQAKLVDGLIYADSVKGVVNGLLKEDFDEDIRQLTVADMDNVKSKDGDEEIAVYFAQGDIVMKSGAMSGGQGISAKKMCSDLNDLADDDDVKAVVIRINSGGGDAYASEQIWHAVSQLKKKKPVVVSMGDLAASGAYYLSCNASWVIAQPNTLTGSIGIFGIIPEFSDLFTRKLAIKYDEVKTNRNSNMLNTVFRSLNSDETSMLTASVNRGYQLFRQRVADGRRLSVAQVEEIAQGHVWIGNDALRIKLIDQLGGLSDAVKRAAELSKTKSYYVEEYPAVESPFDMLLDKETSNYLDSRLQATLGEYYQPFMFVKDIKNRSMIQASLPYCLTVQ